MKNVFWLSLFLCSFKMYAQVNHQFREEGALLIESTIKTGQHYDPGGQSFSLYRFGADTLVEGRKYQIVEHRRHSYFDYESGRLRYHENTFQTFGFIRVDTSSKVFFRPLHQISTGQYFELPKDQDHLLYDFNVEVGDTVFWKTGTGKIVTSIDTIRLDNGVRRKQIVFGRMPGWEFDNDLWIEGIGSSKGLLGSRVIRKSAPGPFVNVTCSYDDQETMEYDYWAREAVSSLGSYLKCTTGLYAPPKEEYSTKETLAVFPNPTNGDEVTLKSSLLLSEIQSVRLYNQLGQYLEEIPIESKNDTYYFANVLLPEQIGIYVIVIALKSQKVVSRKILRF